jgi:hypothetical protein
MHEAGQQDDRISLCVLLQAEGAEAAPAEEGEAQPQEEAPVEATPAPAPAEEEGVAGSKKARFPVFLQPVKPWAL